MLRKSNTSGETNSYVYAYLDPRKPGTYVYEKLTFEYEPFYIGQGVGRRVFAHIKTDKRNQYKYTIIQEILNSSNKPIIKIIKNNISEGEALRLERTVIKTIGRKDKNQGPLTNLTNGGQGHSDPSQCTRDKIGRAHKGKIVSEKSKELMRKNHADFSGTKNPRFGKKVSLKSKELMRNKKLGKTLSEEHKKNMSKAGKDIYMLINSLGKEFIIHGYDDICVKKNNLDKTNLSKLLNGHLKYYKGWTIYKLKINKTEE